MSEVLVPADVVQAILDEATAIGVPASSGIPENKPATFARVVAAGGFQRTLVSDSLTATLELFAATETQALSTLSVFIGSLQKRALLDGVMGNETCYGVQLTSAPQNLPLPSVPTHRRYIATIAADLRRREATL